MDIRKSAKAQRFPILRLIILLGLTLCTTLLVRSVPLTQLEQIRAAGEIHIVSRSGPLSHYHQSSDTSSIQPHSIISGFEYTLLEGFAKELGVKLVVEDEDQLANSLHYLNKPSLSVFSPSVIYTQTQKEQLRLTQAFLDSNLQLVFNNTQSAPSDIHDLEGKTLYYVDEPTSISAVQELQKKYSFVSWQKVDNSEMVDLLNQIEHGTAEYVVVDSAIYQIYHFSFPHAEIAFDLSTPQPLSWALAPNRDTTLFNALQNYLTKVKTNNTLAELKARFFNKMTELSNEDAMMFSSRLETRFPQWEKAIKNAAEQYNVDWQILAAIGYQESNWTAHAESYTGVRGFMMLVPSTAKELGVQDLEDPTQSIYGGAKYLRYLLDVIPESIQGEDRLPMALAAYNQGLGHLEDARVLAEKTGGNPNAWMDVSKTFPLLAKADYANQATYGMARGAEAVAYVKYVMNYQKIIAWKEKQEQLKVATRNKRELLPIQDSAQTKSGLEKLDHIRLSSNSSVSFL